MKLHNAHMLIPEKLWARVGREAAAQGKTKTAIVCRAIEKFLQLRKDERK